MKLTKDSLVSTMIATGNTDGEALHAIDKEEEAVGPEILEVRRVSATQWEARLDSESWTAREEQIIGQAKKSLDRQEPFLAGRRLLSEVSAFKALTGMEWDDWKKWAETKFEGPHPEKQDPPLTRSWRALPDEFTPAIETAYQRYIHSK